VNLINSENEKKPYPKDVGDEEWAFFASSLTLMSEKASQYDHFDSHIAVDTLGHLLALRITLA